MCTLQTLHTVGFRADPALGYDLQGGDIQSAPEQLHTISLQVCVSCVFISILLCCDHNNRKEGCWAGQLAWELVNRQPPLTTTTISEPLEQHKPPCSRSYSPSSEPVLVRFPCQGSATWPAARLGCHRSCWVTRIPRCERKPASTGSHLTLPRCLSTQLHAQCQPFHTKHNLWGAAVASLLKTPPRASFPLVSLWYSVCGLWLFTF